MTRFFTQTAFSLILMIGLLSLCHPVKGQTAQLERANRLYESLAFHEAISMYESALEKRDDLQASIRLADCYRLTSNNAGAVRWYGKVIGSGMAEPIHQLYYAQALLRSGKIEEARAQFSAYVQRSPGDLRGERGLKACEEWDQLATGGIPCRISNLNVNSARSDFSPVMLGEQLLFSSDRDSSLGLERSHLWTGRDFLNVYLSRVAEGGGFRDPVLLPGKVNGPFHDGPVALDSSNRVMYFTRNTYLNKRVGRKPRPSSEGVVKLSILRASRSEGSDSWNLDDWSFAYNNDEYSTGHPAISSDGKTLIFASDRPGGLGGVDLYRSQLASDGTWSIPENLGSQINTAGDELFPVLHATGELLFSSDGLSGLGGLDLYLAGKDSTGWTEPRNLGAPLNSFQDDFSLVMDKSWKRGYFTSNRTGGKGLDDLYALELTEPQLRIRVRDAETLTWLPDIPLSWSKGDMLIAEPRTGTEGEVLLALPRGEQFQLGIDVPNYRPVQLDAPVSDLLSPAIIDWIVDLSPVAEFNLVVEVLDGDTREELLASLVLLENLNTAEREPMLPDPDGYYRMNLEPDTEYRLTADLDGYIGDESVISTKELNPPKEFYEALELYKLDDGLVIELSNIYYDLDKWYIRRDAADDLDRLAELMRRYPAMRIELGSHTDSRATDQYNQILSQRRAESAVAYLVSKGVERDRMLPIGYGESTPRNRCVDDVACTEKEHQFNRRTEFKVINFGRSILSKDKDFIPVNTYQPTNPEYLKNFIEKEMRDMILPTGNGDPGANSGSGQPGTSTGPGRTPNPVTITNPALPGAGGEDVWFQSGRAWGVHLGSGALSSASRFDRFKDLGQVQFEAWTGGRYLFVLGYYTSKTEAEEALKTVLRRGLNEAYLVTYKDGERQN